MPTSKAAKDEFIRNGSEIETDLLKIFSRDDYITIADIGACDGLSSIIYSRIFPHAFIYAFEPRPDNFLEMNNNFIEYGLTGRFKSWNIALGDSAETAVFYESYGDAPGKREGWDTGNRSSSLRQPKKHLQDHKWCRFKPTNVAVKTLDSLSLPNTIDFAHIDVQGAEDKVLRGGRKELGNAKVIWIEVANVELYEGQPLKNEIMKLLDFLGFKVIKDTCGKLHAGDLLCVKK